MQIKQAFLATALEKNIAPLYFLIGQDNYLLNDSVRLIRVALKKSGELDERSLSLQSSQDWEFLARETKTYSLFADALLLNTLYDKKTIETLGKKVLEDYLKEPRKQCTLLIRAPKLTVKALQAFSLQHQIVSVLCYSLDPKQMLAWISAALKKNGFSYAPEVPQLIYQYTEGNHLATAQVIEKIVLSFPEKATINTTDILDYLSDQSHYSLYELLAACLKGETTRAIHMLTQASHNKTEATLVLWMLTQEVRLLLQITHLLEKGVDYKTICGQLKIWAQRAPLYQLANQRLSSHFLIQCLHYCFTLDQEIKSEAKGAIWDLLQKLVMDLCLGEKSCIISPF
jgi:DNA polymerase-3 subunit delta